MFICEIWLFVWYFPHFCTSDMSKYGYLEVSGSLRLRGNESRLYVTGPGIELRTLDSLVRRATDCATQSASISIGNNVGKTTRAVLGHMCKSSLRLCMIDGSFRLPSGFLSYDWLSDIEAIFCTDCKNNTQRA